jgi:hypothetical protein
VFLLFLDFRKLAETLTGHRKEFSEALKTWQLHQEAIEPPPAKKKKQVSREPNQL